VAVDKDEWLESTFEQHRPQLRAVAFRMLGSAVDADDAVQDAWLRVSRADTDKVDNMAAWLTTVTARVCLNVLRSRKQRREEPFVRIPDPVITEDSGTSPELGSPWLRRAMALARAMHTRAPSRPDPLTPEPGRCEIAIRVSTGCDAGSRDDPLTQRPQVA
jgi:RNA polymerase sigma factor (sigma-70 family)